MIARRSAPWPRERAGGGVWRHLAMILLAGMVIDLALMPVALFYFHRAGVYGSMANLRRFR
jgi:competence protein ComEC